MNSTIRRGDIVRIRLDPVEGSEPPDGGLAMRSKISLLQIRSIDKRRVIGCYGTVRPTPCSRSRRLFG